MRIRTPIHKRTQYILNILGVSLAIGFYFWLSYQQHVKNPDDTTLPNFSQIVDGWHRIWEVDSAGTRWITTDLYTTFKRHILGLVFAILTSVVLGMAMGCFPVIDALLKPVMSFFSKIPPTAMLAVFFVIVGTDESFYESMIIFGVATTFSLATSQNVKYDVPMNHIDKAYTLGYSTPEAMVRVFRQILPRLLESIRLYIGPAMVFLIAAEWVGPGGEGFGYRLRIHSRLLNMNVVYIYLTILGMACYLMDSSVLFLRKKACPWFEE
jgi:NitT/TauT family transport system permease protein